MKYKVKDNFILENEVLYKGKMPWILLIVICAICTMSTYMTYEGSSEKVKSFLTVATNRGFWDIVNNAISGQFLLPFVVIMAAYIVGKDYASGFIKNIFVSDNRLNNIIAKYFILLESILFMFLFTFLGVIVDVVCFIKPHKMGDFQTCMKVLLAELLALFAVGTVIYFVTYLAKNTTFSLSFGLIYYVILSDGMFSVINKLVHSFLKIKDFNVKKYMLAGQFDYLTEHLSNSACGRSIIVSAVFIIIFMILTIFVVKNQDV